MQVLKHTVFSGGVLHAQRKREPRACQPHDVSVEEIIISIIKSSSRKLSVAQFDTSV